MNLQSDSLASAFANMVLPTPGGPVSKIPFGKLTPSFLYYSAFLKKSNSSRNSSITSSIPLISSNLILFG